MNKQLFLHIFCSLTGLLFYESIAAQNSDSISRVESTNIGIPKNKVPEKGTYQFILHYSNKAQYAYTEETLLMIADKRLDKTDITVKLNPFVSVFIPSYQTISSKDFKNLEEFISKN